MSLSVRAHLTALERELTEAVTSRAETRGALTYATGLLREFLAVFSLEQTCDCREGAACLQCRTRAFFHHLEQQR